MEFFDAGVMLRVYGVFVLLVFSSIIAPVVFFCADKKYYKLAGLALVATLIFSQFFVVMVIDLRYEYRQFRLKSVVASELEQGGDQ